jgi:hypothetical protein
VAVGRDVKFPRLKIDLAIFPENTPEGSQHNFEGCHGFCDIELPAAR